MALLSQKPEFHNSDVSLLHQMQTSVGIIRGYFDLFCSEGNDDDKKVLYEEINRLGELLRQLVQLKSPEGNLSALDKQSICIESLLKKLLTIFERSNTDHDFRFTIDRIPSTLEIEMDVFLFEECLRALLENAFRHTPPNQKIVFEGVLEGDFLVLSLRNEGVGIPTEFQKQIFDPYFQLGKNKSGSGLGLAIAKDLSKFQNHSLDVESDGESHVTFVLRIPIS